MISVQLGEGHLRTRILCLGHEGLADDGLGPMVAREMRDRIPGAEIRDSGESGVRLLDGVTGVFRVIAVEAECTGTVPAGSVRVVELEESVDLPKDAPSCAGLFEAMSLGRYLGLAVAREVAVIVVEAVDCTTPGLPMHPAVRGAVPRVIETIEHMLV